MKKLFLVAGISILLLSGMVLLACEDKNDCYARGGATCHTAECASDGKSSSCDYYQSFGGSGIEKRCNCK